MGSIDIAVVDDAQCGNQLFFRPFGAAAFVGQGRQRINGGEIAKVAAVIAFHAPDGCDHRGGHAVALGRRLQGGRCLLHLGLAVFDAQRRYRTIQILPGRACEFGLGPVGVHSAGTQACVADIAQGGWADACCAGLDHESLFPALKALRIQARAAFFRCNGGRLNHTRDRRCRCRWRSGNIFGAAGTARE